MPGLLHLKFEHDVFASAYLESIVFDFSSLSCLDIHIEISTANIGESKIAITLIICIHSPSFTRLDEVRILACSNLNRVLGALHCAVRASFLLPERIRVLYCPKISCPRLPTLCSPHVSVKSWDARLCSLRVGHSPRRRNCDCPPDSRLY